jgi:gliding motility-associated-like protein
MRTTLFLFISISLAGSVYAQDPGWQVDPAQYNYSMVMVGIIKTDGVEIQNNNDKVAAFISGEVRGVASPVFQDQVNRNIFYLIIYHNDDGGNVTFKYYNSGNNTVTSAVQTVSFSVDSLIGDAERPFVWSNRVLGKEANIFTYRFPDQLGSKVYSDSVVVRVDIGYNLTAVKPDFTLSDGAGLYIGIQRQTSGVTLNNFSAPVVLTVRSEDEQIIKQYKLRIREEKDEIPNGLFPIGSEPTGTGGMSHLGLNELVKIHVFDQQGRVLFSTTDPQEEWDGRNSGKQVSEGIYFYAIEREDGSKYQGSIQIIY